MHVMEIDGAHFTNLLMSAIGLCASPFWRQMRKWMPTMLKVIAG